jgi:hypothetical protein
MPADDVPATPEIVPALLICHAVPEGALMASLLPVEVTLPVLVIVRGLLVEVKYRLPLAALIVWPPTLTVNVSDAAVEDAPLGAACVAMMVWLALLTADVGVKLHAPLTTGAVPATVPSIDTVTVSPVTPPPEMVGVAVVVSVLLFAGLVIVGDAGAVATLTVNVSEAAVELGPPAAACVAVMVWLALLSAEVGVKLHAPLTTGAVPATLPSIDTVTVSPVTPPPEIVGVAIVVSVLLFAGLVIVGAAGAVATLTVNVSVAAVELGPPKAACVAVSVWAPLESAAVGV